MSSTAWRLLLGLAFTAATSAQAALIQFGGDASIVSDAAYQTQIGATQVIQWNGVDSNGGGFGASGNLSGASGARVGATLTSLGPESLTLTTQAITGAAGAATFASGSPNVLGIFGGGDNGKFQSGPGESWRFDFDQAVTLKHLVFTSLTADGRRVELTLEGAPSITFSRTDPLMAPVSYATPPSTTANRFVYTFAGGGEAIAAGQDINLASDNNAWGLQAVVVEVIPEPTALLLSLLATAGAGLAARRQ